MDGPRLALNQLLTPAALNAALGRWLDRPTILVSTNRHLLKPLILRSVVG